MIRLLSASGRRRTRARAAGRPALAAAAMLLAGGCGNDYWYDSGPSAEADVTTPSGVQTGPVKIAFTLTGDIPTTGITVTFSTNGNTFRDATEGTGSDGTTNLVVSPGGTAHTFVWDSGADLDGAREPSVIVRVRPENGSTVKTDAFAVRNSRFMAAVDGAAEGTARLYQLDAVDGSVSFLQGLATGGVDPFDVLFQGGFFFIAHSTSNNVAVLKVDEEGEVLSPVFGSPFACDGTGSKYLATDGSQVFVSNTGTDTISMFHLESGTGVLTRTSGSGVAAAGCRGLAVVSGRLYVASETEGQVLILDIGSGGTLAANSASPVATGGLASPRALAASGSRVYAANFSASIISGFNVVTGGGLEPLTGSPFTVSASGLEDLGSGGTKLLAVSGAGEKLLSLTLDAFGGLTEDAASPIALDGPSFSVKTAGKFAVAGTTTSRNFAVFTIGSTGTLTPVASSPFSAGAEVLRFAVSD